MTETIDLPVAAGGKAVWTAVPLALGQRYRLQAAAVAGHYHPGATVLLCLAPVPPAPTEQAVFAMPPNAVATVRRMTGDELYARAAVDSGDGEQPCAGRLSYEATA